MSVKDELVGAVAVVPAEDYLTVALTRDEVTALLQLIEAAECVDERRMGRGRDAGAETELHDALRAVVEDV